MNNELLGTVLGAFAHDNEIRNALIKYIDSETHKNAKPAWREIYRQLSDEVRTIEIDWEQYTGMPNTVGKVKVLMRVMYNDDQSVCKIIASLVDHHFGDIYSYREHGLPGMDTDPLFLHVFANKDYADAIREAQGFWPRVLKEFMVATMPLGDEETLKVDE